MWIVNIIAFPGQVSSSDKDASAVRANYPMPRACGIYYFEIEILNRGQKGYALISGIFAE
jgi:hypothetical protein